MGEFKRITNNKQLRLKANTLREHIIKMLTEARDEALQRMLEKAGELGANAIVSVRFSTSTVREGAAEILVYGTAVKIE